MNKNATFFRYYVIQLSVTYGMFTSNFWFVRKIVKYSTTWITSQIFAFSFNEVSLWFYLAFIRKRCMLKGNSIGPPVCVVCRHLLESLVLTSLRQPWLPLLTSWSLQVASLVQNCSFLLHILKLKMDINYEVITQVQLKVKDMLTIIFYKLSYI